MKQILFVCQYFLIVLSLSAQSASHIINYNGVNFRTEPSLDAERLGILYLDAPMEVLQEMPQRFLFVEDGLYYHWYQVRDIESDKVGYVYGKYLTALASQQVVSPIEDDHKEKLNEAIKSLQELIASFEPVLHEPQVHLVSVGVSSYSEAQHQAGVSDLRYADDGARRFAELIEADHTTIITDKYATRQELLSGLSNSLSYAGASDIFILYFSGHGSNQGELSLYDKQVQMQEIIDLMISKNRAVQKYIFVESCHSGLFAEALAHETKDRAAILRGLSDNISILASSQAHQSSWEVGKLGMATFSHYLFLGMQGLADEDMDGLITYGELVQYVSKKVPRYSSLELGKQQEPIAIGNMISNMPLVVK